MHCSLAACVPASTASSISCAGCHSRLTATAGLHLLRCRAQLSDSTLAHSPCPAAWLPLHGKYVWNHADIAKCHVLQVFDLKQQTAHKLRFLQEEVLAPAFKGAARSPVVLIGHSIGATLRFARS